jgi:hypothetical protein
MAYYSPGTGSKGAKRIVPQANAPLSISAATPMLVHVAGGTLPTAGYTPASTPPALRR